VIIDLRDYQEKSVEDLREGFRGGHQSQILVAPTGSGKTVTASHLLGEALRKQSRAFFVCDRVALVDQTSTTLDRYGIQHGIMQADHWRARPWEHIQVVSAQTLARRKIEDMPKLLLWDECHTLYQSVLNFVEGTDIRVIGLTATPFTKGMDKIFTNVVNSTTTNRLIEQGWLVPLKAYAAKEIDMTGAEVKFDGEWKDAEMEKRGIQIVGDVVEEWVQKSSQYFGGPAKTIAFSATVAHGEELCRQFQARGFNFQQISYKDGNNDRRRELIEEFRKADSEIVGLISCEALAKGFDVTDIKIGIGARPYRKSLSGHIQQLGRVMRSHPGKDFALWLCMAKGSRVLTDKGLVPIEKVSKSHKIWDGTNFVTHGGAVCNGIQKVITYQGLTATPGHLVHTAQGWRTFGECAEKQIAITQTGVGGAAIRISENNQPGHFVAREEMGKKTARYMRVRFLRQSINNFIKKFADWKNERMQIVQSARAGISNLVIRKGSSNEGAVQKSKRSQLQKLWGVWHRVSIRWSQIRDFMDNEKYWNTKKLQRFSFGSNKSVWSLRAGEYTLAYGKIKSTQQKRKSSYSKNAQISNGLSGNSICRQHLEAVNLVWNDRSRNYKEVSHALNETEGEVWDILDAGPNNRFTCEGLLVHNCHSGNMMRFMEDTQEVFENGISELNSGALDAKLRKEKTPEEKKDSKCHSCGFIHTQKICPACGAERPVRRSTVEERAGQLSELDMKMKAKNDWQKDKKLVWKEICHIATDIKGSDRFGAEKFALAQYRNLYGTWPKAAYHIDSNVVPREVVRNNVRRMLIAYRHRIAKKSFTKLADG
jgi:hypothetical protein